MYAPRLPDTVTLLGSACECRRSTICHTAQLCASRPPFECPNDVTLCALPRHSEVTMLGAACECRHSLLCASSPRDVTLCRDLPFHSMCVASRRRHTAHLCLFWLRFNTVCLASYRRHSPRLRERQPLKPFHYIRGMKRRPYSRFVVRNQEKVPDRGPCDAL